LPGRFTGPETLNTFVPALFSVPHCRYQAAPFLRMGGTHMSVSVLFTTVGQA